MAISILHYSSYALICPCFCVTFSVRAYIHNKANKNTEWCCELSKTKTNKIQNYSLRLSQVPPNSQTNMWDG